MLNNSNGTILEINGHSNASVFSKAISNGKKTGNSNKKDFYVIGIGASAGGLEALKEFFDHVPEDIHHSFVIVQHLSPDYKSLMTELLAKNTKLPIYEVTNNMEIQPGSIYLIPTKKNMTIHDKVLYLVDKPLGHDLNLPIDIFFNSLAEDQGSKAIGVILTGTGSDGTRGLLAIKEAGGMAMVQNPETARFNGMPGSAVSTGLMDHVLTIDQMAGEILHYISYPKLEHTEFDKLLMNDEDTVMKILVHLKNFTNLDFTSYKRPTLIRRISRRMTVNNCADASEYLKYLTENSAEAQVLYKEFLIGVTRFFRDAKAENKLADVLNEALTEELGCASLYVDQSLNIVHAYGNLNSYITLPEKGFSVNLQRMLPDSIVIAINTAIRKTIKEKCPAVYKGVRLRQGNKVRKIVVLVKPFQMDKLDSKKYYLIVFFEHSLEELPNKKVKDFSTQTKNSALINDLEQELKETKANLQLTIEELETSNEELQATNEEMLAANEELQSTNEELQSVNEELHTVKARHQEKIQELANVNADMDNFLRSTEVGTIFLDRNLRIRSFTPAIKDHFNLFSADVGRPISNFTNNLGNISILNDVTSVLESGTQIEKEVLSGSQWYLMRLLPYKNEMGQTEGIVITFVDITNLVSIKKALAESQRSFDSFMEHSPMLTWIKNEKGEYIYINKAFENHFGVSRQFLIGKTDSAVYPINIALKLQKKIHEVTEKWETETSIEKIARDNETHIYKTVRFPFIGLEDDNRYIGGISQDITEQVKAEENLVRSEARLKEAESIAHVGGWEIEMATDKHLWSDELYKIFGIENNEEWEPSTETFLSVIHPDDLPIVNSQVEKAYAKWQDSSFSFRFSRKNDKEIRHGFAKWKFDFDENGKPIRMYGIVMDVTDQKKAEEERAKMTEDIIQRNKNLEQFSYVVSHNLRAPVANIIGLCHAIQAGITDPEEQKEFIKLLSKSVQKLDEIIIDLNDVLDVKRQIGQKKEKVSFTEISEEIVTSLKTVIKNENARIVTDFSEADEMMSQKGYIRSIFYNLISNSLKYHRPNISPVVQVKSFQTDGKMGLKFKDNGLGINMGKDGDKIFGLYKRFHTDKAEGKGIGLFLVKTQVEALGGTINISSKVDQGTEFIIDFKG